LPRAVHLDDEVARTLSRAGVGAEFLARSRPCSGLRLLDAQHQVLAELGRAASGVHGAPQANMFHQPDLEELLLGRAARHPLITLHRTADVIRISGLAGAISSSPVTVTARTGASGQEREFAGSVVLGCDGAGSTVRELAGLTMEDLGFTERWLVIDIRVAGGLDAWDGVEQVCDPARAATFMQVTGDRYRWEFQLRAGEDESDLLTPAALGGLLAPWTGRADLDGLEVVRSTSYIFRARLASSFRAGRVFLLGDAAHLTPPFIGQGLAAGLRDADNLAWKIADVLAGRSGEDLLDSYDAERRPHARAMVKKAVMIGWAMTGGQDRAAAVRRVALAAAVRVAPVRGALAATATPRLKTGALRRPGRWRMPVRPGPRVRPGSLIPNPLVRVPAAVPVRLDAILAGRTTVLTARQPEATLTDLCDRYGIQLLRVRPENTPDESARRGSPRASQPDRWIEVRLAGGEPSGPMRALIARPGLAILVRPDRVIAAAAAGRRLPVVPWPIMATRGRVPASAHAICPDPAGQPGR
ncbi:MAG TPA: bifunctional 3-(3-hydroxy-phenyl)propionate/3-hydroxycinnamic acid hydroxylase, partial [Streptosporangiaceae bacterium]|nr:bifunctional 3-(3-hydroxy-phenyl)propionate/3-hydroxycinnamic acid hydroxylase [Streptosporangiaceae bacterium]